MSLPFLHSPSEVIQQLLIDMGIGFDPEANPNNPVQPDWNVYEDKEPSSPDNVLTIYDTTPKSSGRSMIDGEQWMHYGIQVRVRGTNKQTAFVKADSVRRMLDEHVVSAIVTLEGKTYLVPAICNTNMVRMGQQSPSSKRFIYTINGTSAIIRQT